MAAADRRRRTPWFPRNINPVHHGEYECAVRITSSAPPLRWSLPWDGKGFIVPFPMIVLRWRGLVKKPSAGVPVPHHQTFSHQTSTPEK